MSRSRVALAALAALAAAVTLLAGCAPWAESHPAARVVSRVLELRSARSTDASAYGQLFADPAVASMLASDAAAATSTPIPAWRPPYVSALETSAADVVVVWRASKDPKGWPRATVFKLRFAKGAWHIADALPLETSATPAALSQPGR